jgi:cytoskeletal protein CcmA (bactofilin family)
MSIIPSEKAGLKEGGNRTLLMIQGESARINGDFVINQSVEIDCEVQGKLEVHGQVIIQKNGFVKAEIKTEKAEIIGRFEGTLEAKEYIEVKETGSIYGNIKTDCLVINKGGIFSGSIERLSDVLPLAKPGLVPAASKAADPLSDKEPRGAGKLSL